MSEDEHKIRVVIADDVAATRDILAKALYFEKDIVVVATAASGSEAIQMAGQYQPDVVVMDIDMPGLDGIAATEAIMNQAPATQVIVMSAHNEPEYLRRAMLAGAYEYVIKPPDTDELARSIRHVARSEVARATGLGDGSDQPGNSETGKIVSVFSPKGGTGRTSVACNLAVALRQISGKKVVLVDGDIVFGDIDVAMDTRAHKTILDLTSRIDELDATLIADTTVPHPSQVRLLLGPPDSQSGEAITPDQLRTVLEALRHQFDYVVVDTPTSYDDRTLTMLDVSDRILVLVTLELTTIKNVRRFLELAGLLGYGDEKLVLVLNKSDVRLGIKAESVEAQIRRKFTAQIGNAPTDMTLALNQGVPLVVERRNHPVARDMVNLAGAVIAMLKPGAAPVARPAVARSTSSKGLLGRLSTKR